MRLLIMSHLIKTYTRPISIDLKLQNDQEASLWIADMYEI